MNYNGKIDLLKLQGASVNDLNFATGVKRCIVIPIYEAGLFEGAKGVYLDMKIWQRERESYGESHLIKASVSGERWKAMSEDERNAIPILGGLKPAASASSAPVVQPSEPEQQSFEDLPL